MSATPFHYRLAARVLHGGGVIAYPTEAVFGLGCHPLNLEAVTRLLEIKGRPEAKGFILVAADISQIRPYSDPIEKLPGYSEILSTWPGPFTWILPASRHVPEWITGGRNTIAVRVSAHEGVIRLCRAFGGAIISTSANQHLKEDIRLSLRLRKAFGHHVDYLVPGKLGGDDSPSQIRDGISGKRLR